MSGHLRRRVTRGCHGFNLGAGIRLCGLDEDLPEIGEPDETEDMFQILALLIPAFCAGTEAYAPPRAQTATSGLPVTSPL